MTNQEIIDYYSDLLIMQYKGKPKAQAHIEALADMCIMDNISSQIMNAYEIGSAKGVQLDVLGKYAGVERTGYTFTKQVTLNDDDFTKLIKLAIIKNNSNSDLLSIITLLQEYFFGQIYVFDYQGMRMSYYISSSIASQDLAEMFISQGLLPKPMGVTLSATVRYPTLDGFFGYRSYQSDMYNNAPYSSYEDQSQAGPWLQYEFQIGKPIEAMSFLMTENLAYLTQENNSKILT